MSTTLQHIIEAAKLETYTNIHQTVGIESNFLKEKYQQVAKENHHVGSCLIEIIETMYTLGNKMAESKREEDATTEGICKPKQQLILSEKNAQRQWLVKINRRGEPQSMWWKTYTSQHSYLCKVLCPQRQKPAKDIYTGEHNLK